MLHASPAPSAPTIRSGSARVAPVPSTDLGPLLAATPHRAIGHGIARLLVISYINLTRLRTALTSCSHAVTQSRLDQWISAMCRKFESTNNATLRAALASGRSYSCQIMPSLAVKAG